MANPFEYKPGQPPANPYQTSFSEDNKQLQDTGLAYARQLMAGPQQAGAIPSLGTMQDVISLAEKYLDINPQEASNLVRLYMPEQGQLMGQPFRDMVTAFAKNAILKDDSLKTSWMPFLQGTEHPDPQNYIPSLHVRENRARTNNFLNALQEGMFYNPIEQKPMPMQAALMNALDLVNMDEATKNSLLGPAGDGPGGRITLNKVSDAEVGQPQATGGVPQQQTGGIPPQQPLFPGMMGPRVEPEPTSITSWGDPRVGVGLQEPRTMAGISQDFLQGIYPMLGLAQTYAGARGMPRGGMTQGDMPAETVTQEGISPQAQGAVSQVDPRLAELEAAIGRLKSYSPGDPQLTDSINWVSTKFGLPRENVKDMMYGKIPIALGSALGQGAQVPKLNSLLQQQNNPKYNGEVKTIQEILKGLGYNITVDGKFGPGTVSAVKEFQKKNGLQVDGKVGQRTWETLFRQSGRGKSPVGGGTGLGGLSAPAGEAAAGLSGQELGLRPGFFTADELIRLTTPDFEVAPERNQEFSYAIGVAPAVNIPAVLARVNTIMKGSGYNNVYALDAAMTLMQSYNNLKSYAQGSGTTYQMVVQSSQAARQAYNKFLDSQAGASNADYASVIRKNELAYEYELKTQLARDENELKKDYAAYVDRFTARENALDRTHTSRENALNRQHDERMVRLNASLRPKASSGGTKAEQQKAQDFIIANLEAMTEKYKSWNDYNASIRSITPHLISQGLVTKKQVDDMLTKIGKDANRPPAYKGEDAYTYKFGTNPRPRDPNTGVQDPAWLWVYYNADNWRIAPPPKRGK